MRRYRVVSGTDVVDLDVTYREVWLRVCNEEDGTQATVHMTRDAAQRLSDAIVKGLQENQR